MKKSVIFLIVVVCFYGKCVGTNVLAYDGEDPFIEISIQKDVLVEGEWMNQVELIMPWSLEFMVEIENFGNNDIGQIMVLEAVACDAGLLFDRSSSDDGWNCVNQGLYHKNVDLIQVGSSVRFEHEFKLKENVENGYYYCVAHAAITTTDYFEYDSVSPYKEVNIPFSINVNWDEYEDIDEEDESNDGNEDNDDNSNADDSSNDDTTEDNNDIEEENTTDVGDSIDSGRGSNEDIDIVDNADDKSNFENNNDSIGDQSGGVVENRIGALGQEVLPSKQLAESGDRGMYTYFLTGLLLICYNIFYVTRYQTELFQSKVCNT